MFLQNFTHLYANLSHFVFSGMTHNIPKLALITKMRGRLLKSNNEKIFESLRLEDLSTLIHVQRYVPTLFFGLSFIIPTPD